LKISSVLTAQIVEWVNRYVELAQQIPGFPKEKDSGYCVVKCLEGRTLLVFQVGQVPFEKVGKYLCLADEKANRLGIHAGLGHRSSWQSRDGLNKWGGAVLVGDLIFSFSGLPELADEAVMLLAARACGLMAHASACGIAHASNNKFLHALDMVPQAK